MEVHRSIACVCNEPLDISQVIEIVKSITRLSLKPQDNEVKQIELITELENFITADDNGDMVIETIFSEDFGCFHSLLHMINIYHYPNVIMRILSLIYKCLSQKRHGKGNSARRMSLTVIYDKWPKLLEIIYKTDGNFELGNNSSNVIDNINYYLLLIISQLCKKDKEFWKNFEKKNFLIKISSLLLQYSKSIKISVTVLNALKNIIRSRIVVQAISNKTFFGHLETIFSTLKKKKSNKIKLVPIIIKLLSKYDIIQDSIFETKLIQQLLSLLANDDNLPVTYSLCRTILFSINKIIKKESSLKLFKNHTNIRLLYRFCTHFSATEDKHFTILLKACSMIHACIEQRELPIASINCYENTTNINYGKDDVFSDTSDIDEEDNDEEYYSDSDESDQINLSDNREKIEWSNFNAEPDMPLDDKPLREINKYLGNLYEDRSKSLNIYNNIDSNINREDLYCTLTRRVQTKRQFVNIPYPDVTGAQSCTLPHLLLPNYAKFSRSKLIDILDSALNEKIQTSQVVFDLDQLQKNGDQSNVLITCTDLKKLTKNAIDSKTLQFESRFEGGNLRKVIKISQFAYNLILAPDVNVKSKYQWFYFQITNMKAQIPYVFNILNCDKSNTQYNHGMQPVLFSVKEAVFGNNNWFRSGIDICYYRNNYVDRTQPSSIYHTLSFTVRFLHSNDVCYLAYHFPYTYTKLMTFLYDLHVCPPNNVYCTVETLCHTLANNPVPLVTITAPSTISNPIESRKLVVLTSRVHPAESNASWAMEGTLRYLLQDIVMVQNLRDEYVFKIVPMQNPEGVIYGSYRYGLTAEDLNRCWRNPDAGRHPEVFHVKAMMQTLKEQHGRNISLFIDYHGHSRERNFFLYGCSNKYSWKKKDRRTTHKMEECLIFPTVLADMHNSFSLSSCKFNVEKTREATARVSIWREFGIQRSYTMECTYCGFDVGPYKSQSINTVHLFDIGASLMRGLWALTGDAGTLRTSLSRT